MSTNLNQDSRFRMTNLVVLVASLAAVAGILFGFDTGVISGAILFIKLDFELTPFMNGMVVAAVLIGAMIGSVVSGHFADVYGRRKMLIVTAILFLGGTISYSLAPTITWLVVSRIVVGFAIGISSYTAPLYISELAPVQSRGMLVSLNQLAITVGIMLAYLVDAFFASSQNWRAMLAFGCIPALILLVSMIFLPESPRWLILVNRLKEAKETLQKVRGSKNVDVEIDEIKDSIVDRGNWHLLLQKWLRPALLIGLGLGFFQQCTGINTIIYYAPTIFKAVGFERDLVAILATSGIGAVNVIATIIALPLLDRVGRKPLLYIGMVLMALSLLVLSFAFFVNPGYGFFRWVAMGSMIVFIIGFAIGLGPVMWLLFSEIFPLEIRGLATSVTVAASWAFNGVVAWTFLPMLQSIGGGATFLIFGLLCIVGLLFVYYFVSETKGVTLEHIEHNLRSGLPSRELGRAVE